MVMGASGQVDGDPSGSVQFYNGAALAGTASLTPSTALNVTSTATLSANNTSANYTAVYAGDANFQGSSSPAPTKTATAVKLTSSPNPSAAGQSVTLTATLVAAATGTVDFLDGTALLARAPLAGGVATLATAFSSAGPHYLSANYNGDANYLPSSSASYAQTVTPPSGALPGVVIASIANVIATVIAPDEIVTIWGASLANAAAAAAPPLPVSLAGASVTVTDSAGVSRMAPLYYASPGQINLVVPAGTASGPAIVALGGLSLAVGVTPVSPSLFNAAQIVVVHPDNTQTLEDTSAPIVFGSNSLYLVLYATGLRNRSSLAAVTCAVGNLSLPVTYAGAQSQFPGLDQVVLQLPAALQGAGKVNVVVTADGYSSNPVSITFQ
jgi:uncharacterized protein (TIGR03437 family)